MSLLEIIKAAIREAGGNGLVNLDLGCGCGLDDFMPCDSPCMGECQVATARVLEKGEAFVTDWVDLGPGDTLYEPLDVKS